MGSIKHCAVCGGLNRGYFALLYGELLCLMCYWWAFDLIATPFVIPKIRLVKRG